MFVLCSDSVRYHTPQYLSAQVAARRYDWGHSDTDTHCPNTASRQALALFIPHTKFHLICHLPRHSECKSLQFIAQDAKELHFISGCQGSDSIQPCTRCYWCNSRCLNQLISQDDQMRPDTTKQFKMQNEIYISSLLLTWHLC